MTNNSRQCFCHLFLLLALFVGNVAGQSTPQAPVAGTASQSSAAPGEQEGELPILRVVHQADLAYPPLARTARIQGEVSISFKVDQDGAPTSLAVISGHLMLVQAALDNLKTWRFAPPKNGFPPGQTYVTTFVYKISTDLSERPLSTRETVNGMPAFRIEIMAYDGPITKDCPSPTQPTVILTPQDFVELSHSGCYGTCPIYTVRISASGEINWQGDSYVRAVGKRRSRMNPQQARALIERFRTPEFWSLCESYTTMISDSDTAQIKLQLGSDGKAVSDYADSAPSWVRELEGAIDKAANTDRWIGKHKPGRGLQ